MKKSAIILAPLSLAAGQAFAALPAEAQTTIDTAKTDLTTVGGSILVMGIAFWGVRILGKKMGWWA